MGHKIVLRKLFFTQTILHSQINCPQDIKGFTPQERQALAQEMREAMLKRARIHGGHFGPDFGIVDKIIAELIQEYRV